MGIATVFSGLVRRAIRSKLTVVTSLALMVILIFKLDIFTSDSLERNDQGIVRAAVGVVRKMGGNMNTVYDERRNTLLTACSLNNVHKYDKNSEQMVRKHFVVDRRNKILFCGMEKVGCTFWRRVFQITAGVKNKTNPFDIIPEAAHDGSLETFGNLPFHEILELVNSFTKFIFVREPYSRIFSGYVDKVFGVDGNYFPLSKRIAEYSGTRNATGCVHISFQNFLHYVLNTLKTDIDRNGHFVPMYDHCKPCALRYDIIGKMETTKTDVNYLIESQNLQSVVDVNLTGQTREIDTIKETFRHTYRYKVQIEKCMPFVNALKFDWRKLQIRGIIEKQIPFPAQFQADHVSSQDEIISEAMKASERSDPVKRKANKREALIEAFRSVSAKDLAEYRDIFSSDFKIFGYDIEPSDMFSEDLEASNFSYFQI